MAENNPVITDGIDTLIAKSIEKSIANNSKETFAVLKSFVRRILQESIKGKSVAHFARYIFFPASMYQMAYIKQKESITLSPLYKIISEEAASMLKEVIWMDLGITMKNAKNQEDRKFLNYFYYHSFSGFSRYLYYTIYNRDFQRFKFATNEIRQLTNPQVNNSYALRVRIRQLEREGSGGNIARQIADLKETAEMTSRFDLYKRHVIIGLRSWLFYLYDIDQLKWPETNQYLERLQISNASSDEYIRDILSFRNNPMIHAYMDWGSWDFMERETWNVFTPPNPSDWLTMGFLIEQIRENRLYISLEELDEEESRMVEFLHLNLIEYVAKFKSEFGKWKDVLNTASLEILTQKTDPILSIFASLKKKSGTARNAAVASAPLNEELVDAFRKDIGEAWQKQARIRSLFNLFKNTKHVPLDGQQLKVIGQRTFLERAKIMFIDGEYHNPIYGITRMGSEIGRWEDEAFFDNILGGEFDIQGGKSILEILENGLAVFTRKELSPTVILLSPEFSYRDEELLRNPRFQVHRQTAETEDEKTFQLGTFDGIPMYTSFSTLLDNKVIICDFAGAFSMKYKTDATWFENILRVDVQAISDEQARQKFAAEPVKWKSGSDGILLSDEEAITLIKTSVLIDIWSTLDYEVKNASLYLVGFINL